MISLGAIGQMDPGSTVPSQDRLRATPVSETTESMADDNRFRSTRPGDSFRRAAEPSRSSGHASDPLAELARLIGKNDPYAEFGLRDASSGEPQEGYSSAVPRREDYHRAPSHEQYQESYQGSELARGRDSYDAHRDGYRAYESVPPVHDARQEDWRADGGRSSPGR